MKMRIPFMIFLLAITNTLYAQTWTAGDTTNFHLHQIEQTFEVGSNVQIDMDCDGVPDLVFSSSGPTEVLPWYRLSFYMIDDVEVYNANTGFVTTFEAGQNVPLDIGSNWTSSLDFIWGTGELGPYGQDQIDGKYILYRKNTGADIVYCPIFFSSNQATFTIHHILSDCEENPIGFPTSTLDQEKDDPLILFPNPSSDNLYTSLPISEYEIYSMEGRLVDLKTIPTNEIAIRHLGPGVYRILMKVKSGYVQRVFVKH